ncbi:DUF58 domain-containing protein [Candidatus Woesearchaeota archaeon]|nr:DUF58 domain-containing protein [Candidatus Woesearchaeota archaeon]
MIQSEFLHQLDKLNLVVKKKVTSHFTGERRTQYLGSGLLFHEYVPYVFGEDIKAVDWKVYGRTDRLFVKKFEEDRNLTVHVLVDFSGSMNFGAKIKKFEYASMIGLGFVYLAMKDNERFVLSTFDDTLDFFKPRKGQRQLAAILHYLNTKQPKGGTDIQHALAKYKELVNSKSLIIIISDFFYDPELLANVLHRYKKNKIKFIQVLDPLENKLNLEGDYHLTDLESDTKLHTYIDPYLRKQYFDSLHKHIMEIQKKCLEVNADFYTINTDEDLFDVFYKIL